MRGRAPSQAFPQRPRRRAQGQWRGNRLRGWTASARERCCNFPLCPESGSWEASTHKRRAWAHTVLLGPEPSLDHSTIGLTVAPLEVLSRVRWAPAETQKVQHDANDFCGCSGKACDRAAWAHYQKGGREPPCSIWPRSTKICATTTPCRKDMRYRRPNFCW